jgi:glycosyltransferase involved in cell wall biosynthesis
MRRRAGVDDEHTLLVNAARLAPEKAQDQLLRSFRIVHERFPLARLWIMGVGLEPVERNLQAIRRELGLEHAVRLGGFSEDFWSLCHVADVMVHPSHVEGVPLAIMGGMAAGLPIVASNVGGIGELIVHGRTGLLVRENDEVAFAQRICDVLADPARARAMGEAARTAVQGEHSIRVAVARVEEIYRELTGPDRLAVPAA